MFQGKGMEHADVVELADTLDLGSNAHQRESSSLSRNTIQIER